MNPFLFVALDDLAGKEKETFAIAKQLSDMPGNFGFKLNLDYLLNRTKSLETIISKAQTLKRPIFADIKMWNGTRTMKSVFRTFVDLEVEYVNVYALADDLLPKAIEITEGTVTKVLGLTTLTHYDNTYCLKHFKRTLPETVLHFSEVAIEAGCHGVILPGTMLHTIKHINTIKGVPGVRPNWYEDDRHEEEVTPKEAIENGADILVVGGPIMKSAAPASALEKILSEGFKKGGK
ncbi:MAG: orotidine 5'-phosphate decarboxylase [Patescibacteria group bacterium]